MAAVRAAAASVVAVREVAMAAVRAAAASVVAVREVAMAAASVGPLDRHRPTNCHHLVEQPCHHPMER